MEKLQINKSAPRPVKTFLYIKILFISLQLRTAGINFSKNIKIYIVE